MGRHRTPDEKRELGERARAMRQDGLSRRQIMAELHVGDDLLASLLVGTEVPPSLRRPNAKDDLRARAVELRRAGATYDQIVARLGVSKSSCSLWLRRMPHPATSAEHQAAAQDRRLAAARARAARDRAERDAAGALVVDQTASFLGEVTSRDLVLALAVSYWCEGAKRKPWNRTEVVKWMNSDPVLVRLFLEGLHLLGVEPDRLKLRLHIHENADEVSARQWWSVETGVSLTQFQPSTIKRHNPRTRRNNVGDSYRGCLCITVRQSRQLYQVVEGLVKGLAERPRAAVADGEPAVGSEGVVAAQS